jgi:hypothetical protein
MTKGSKCTIAGILLLPVPPLLMVTYYLAIQHYTPTDSMYSVVLGWATDTSWPENYRESRFKQVKLGMTRDQVRKIMGDPGFVPNTDYWGYTWSPSSTHYHQRGFVFSSAGIVTNVVRGFYFD